MATDINVPDFEIDALMAELEADSLQVMAEAKPAIPAAPAAPAAEAEDDLEAALAELSAEEPAAPVDTAAAAAAPATVSVADRIKAEAAKKAAALAAEEDPEFAAQAALAEKAKAEKEAKAEAKAKADAEAEAADAAAKKAAEDQAKKDAQVKAEMERLKAEAKAKAAAEAAAEAAAAEAAAKAAVAEAEAKERAEAQAHLAAATPTPKAEPRRPTEDVPAGSAAGLRFGIDVEQFQRDTRVSEAQLDNCFMEQASLRAFYGTQAAQAEAQATRHKARFEVIEATLFDQHRKALAKSEEKVTEKMVENAVKLDPRWLRAKNVMIDAETIAAINKSLVDSLRDRKDMLVQLGADRREGMKGQLRMAADQNERESMASRAAAAAQAALGANRH